MSIQQGHHIIADQSTHLAAALKRLFTPTQNLGFWDEKRQRIHSRLDHDRNWQWQVNDEVHDRYGCFTLTAILLAKDINDLDTKDYDDQICGYLYYLKARISTMTRSDLSYGAYAALALGQKIYPYLKLNDAMAVAWERLRIMVPVIRDNHDALLFIGASYHLDHLAAQYAIEQSQLYLDVKKMLVTFLDIQDETGFFSSGDIRAAYLQRCLYPLWGLAVISKHMFKERISQAILKALTHIWQERRESVDDGLIWHPPMMWPRTRWGWRMPYANPISSCYLFECHQTFFVNAVQLYQHFFERGPWYQDQIAAALAWIFGENRIQTNLLSLTGLDLPARMMNQKGELFLPGEMFKGSYEIGSYILALSYQKKATDAATTS